MKQASSATEPTAKGVLDRQCAAVELDFLVGVSVEDDRVIAKHENVGEKTLKKLARSDDEKTRELVAGNPNTPLDVLIQLADEFPRAFLLNPVFDIIVFKDPGFIEQLDESTLAKILAQKECPQPLISWAYKFYKNKTYGRSKVLLGVVRNPSTPIKVINAILKIESEASISYEEGFL